MPGDAGSLTAVLPELELDSSGGRVALKSLASAEAPRPMDKDYFPPTSKR